MVQETKLNIMIPDKKVIDITTYIASFSGGKDSIAMVLRLIEENKPLDRVAFIDTELEFGEQNNIIKICERRFKELKPGLEFDYIRPAKTFEEYFYTVKKKGKFKGQIYGWPFTAGFNSWCNDRLKQRPFRKYQKQFDDVIIYLGIAADEPKRLKSIIRVINQSIKYNKLPSEILRIDDEYTSFCFDEACMYISNEIEAGNEAKWKDEELTTEEVRKKACDLASQLRMKGGEK